MDKWLDLFDVLIGPLTFLIICLLILVFVIRPLLNYFALVKEIKMQQKMQEEYRQHKEKIKQERQMQRAEKEAILQRAIGGGLAERHNTHNFEDQLDEGGGGINQAEQQVKNWVHQDS